jgi:uncharacterized MnhB-related membrane protein
MKDKTLIAIVAMASLIAVLIATLLTTSEPTAQIALATAIVGALLSIAAYTYGIENQKEKT